VVALRGTNPVSLSTWLLEDFDVSNIVPWPYAGAQAPLEPCISKGTLLAILGIQSMRADGKLLIEFLRDVVAAHPSAQLTFTGHSLGGLLASTLAVAFLDQRTAWDPAGHVAVDVHSFAAPTAGNRDFAAHSDGRLQGALHRVWNTHDVAPHAWEIDALNQLSDLYRHEADVWWLAGFRFFMVAVHAALQGRRYTQVGGAGTALQGKPSRAPGFLFEAIHQHGQAYIELLGLEEWLNQFDVMHLRHHAEQRLRARL